MLACAPLCGCTLTCSAPKSCLRAIDRQLLDHVDIFAAAIPSVCRITFGVLVRQAGTLRLHHRAAGEIFRRRSVSMFSRWRRSSAAMAS